VIVDAILAGGDRIDDRHQRLAQLAVARGQIEHWHLGGGERFGEDADDA